MFDKLKNLFIEDDGKPVKEPQAPKPTKSASAKKEELIDYPKAASKPSTTKSSTSGASGKPNPKFVNVLLKAIEANNLEGFDYLEFKQALQNLNSVEMDKQTKYQSALAMAKTMGASPKNLLASAKHYLKVLAKEEHKFQTALKGQRTTQVQGKKQEIKQHEQAISDKQKQIAKLQTEIKEHSASLTKTKGSIQKAADKVEATNQSFLLAYEVVKSKIEEDINNMNQFF